MATSSAGTALSRSGPRNFAVRWNEPSLFRMIPSSTRAAQGRKSARRALEWRYSARFIMIANSEVEMTGNAQMSAHYIDEGWIALSGPDGSHVTDEPEDETRNPQPQPKSKGSCQCAIDDRDRSRCTAHQDRLGERTVNRHDKTCYRLIH